MKNEQGLGETWILGKYQKQKKTMSNVQRRSDCESEKSYVGTG